MVKEYSILIGGAAGEGPKKAGLIIAKFFSNYGYKIYVYEDYQSIIKGGHNFSLIRASSDRVIGSREDIDFLLALNEDTAARHKKKLNNKKNLIYNDVFSAKGGIGVSVNKIVEEFKGIPIMRNTALVGAFAKVIGINWATAQKVLKQELPIETEMNLKIAKAAYNQAETVVKIEKLKSKPLPLISGNEAIALGAISAGLEAYVGYPMTPSTGVLNYMAQVATDHNIRVYQPENEISAINTAIGLAFSGRKTMTGSSGGGFDLMTEGLSLTAQSETPLVVIEAQRMGPATGVPTYNAIRPYLCFISWTRRI
ncbi:MAG: 2-oxoacid:acceptor oxidoreductase family protein [Candidatus Nealsonbacteria bacterium]|nr:2-oxoacid:acceptor oxidoreductase family protein [Candidatus Nealsonbacteria bacterium]